MTARSTRNRIRHQANEAFIDLKRAEDHIAQLGAIAGERSKYIEDNLPEILAALTVVTETFDKFREGL